MHPRTQELLDYLDATRQTLATAVDAVPLALRDRRPAPDRWSVADIIEHLVIVESRILALLTSTLTPQRLEELGRDAETSSVLPMLDLQRLLDRTQRITTGDASRPTGGVALDVSWATLTARRQAMRNVVIATDGYALGLITAPHPRLGPLTYYQWILFIGAHEARHAAQIDELRHDVA